MHYSPPTHALAVESHYDWSVAWSSAYQLALISGPGYGFELLNDGGRAHLRLLNSCCGWQERARLSSSPGFRFSCPCCRGDYGAVTADTVAVNHRSVDLALPLEQLLQERCDPLTLVLELPHLSALCSDLLTLLGNYGEDFLRLKVRSYLGRLRGEE